MLSKEIIEKFTTCANNEANNVSTESNPTQIVKEILEKHDTATFQCISAFEAGRIFERISKTLENPNQDLPIHEIDTEDILKRLKNVEGEANKGNKLFEEMLPYVERAFIYGYLKALEDKYSAIEI